MCSDFLKMRSDFGTPALDGFGRAIARWNHLGMKMIISFEIFASRAPRARSARKCGFFTS